jgi:plastocyanin
MPSHVASPSVRPLAALLLAAALFTPVTRADDEPAAAEEAGSVHGTVRGTVPVGKGAEPVLVYLKDVPGDYAPRVRSVDIKNGQLTPKVVVVAVGDTVKFVNQDAQAHTVTSLEGGADLGLLDKGDARGQLFLRPGGYAVRCAVHKELLGYVFVAPGPYATVADKAGAYEMKDVPPGHFAVATWTPGARGPSESGEASPVDVAQAAPAATPPSRSAAPSRAPAAQVAAREKPRSEFGTIRGKVEAEPARFIEETVVYLKNVPGTYPPRRPAMDQRKMRFIPRVLPVTVGDTVRFLNNDGLAHNVFSNDGEGYNLGMFKDGEERTHTFTKPGTYAQLCNIHPEMLAYIFVSQNPYLSTVDASGHYEIRNVPPGQYTISIWNSHLSGPDKPVSVERGGTVDVGFALRR